MRNKRMIGVLCILALIAVVAVAFPAFGDAFQPELWVKRIIMEPTSGVYPGIYLNSTGAGGDLVRLDVDSSTAFEVNYDGSAVHTGVADVDQLTVTGYTTQTNDLLLLQNSAATERVAVAGTGQTVFSPVADSDTGSYDNLVTIQYYMTGTGKKDRNYGLYVTGQRPAGQELTDGDHDEVGIKVRVDTHAITTTVGTSLKGVEAEAKADNPDGTVTNLYGGSFTAKSDTGAGDVAQMVGLQANATNNAAVTGYLVGADIRLSRDAAVEPTEEYVLHVRNGSYTGTGPDAAIFIESDGHGSYPQADDFNYGLDMSAAEIDDGDIRLQNGGIIDEGTDTVITFSEFGGYVEQTPEVVGAGTTIVPTGTYQPITSASSITTSTTTPIQAGTFTGQLLILINENASHTITVDGTGGTCECGGDVVLGADDAITLLWDGADWLCIAEHDN